jgi:GRAM domain
MKIDLRPNEKLIREGGANLQRGIEAVGGKLFLTDQRLFFQSHSINVQTGATEIPLSDIRGTELCWTKFLGVIPLFPNTLAVHTVSGVEYRFVLYGRKEWATAIGAQQQLAGA